MIKRGNAVAVVTASTGVKKDEILSDEHKHRTSSTR